MPPHPLPRAAPESRGLDSSAVTDFLDAIDGRPELELHSLMVVRHGHVLAEGWWHPYTPDQLHLLYSLSKSFTSAAAGLAAAEGRLDLDAQLVEIFPEHADVIADGRVRRMTLRHLLRMASGHRSDVLSRARQTDPDDLVRGFFRTPPEEEPGSIFAYNNGATFVIAAAVQKAAGQTLVDYLTPRLFRPIGIDRLFWASDSHGRNLGYSGLHLTTESVARFGQLILNGGRWNGQQLLDPGWLRDATRKQTDNSANKDSDWRQGYGYQFWMARHGFRGDGACGQFCLILPEQDAVIVMTAAATDPQAVLDRVWELLLPGFADHELPAAAPPAAVADRLSYVSLPAPGASGFVPGAPPAADAPIAVTAVDWRDDDVVEIALAHIQPEGSDDSLRLECGVGHWRDGRLDLDGRELAYAGSGGWSDDGSFDADVAFVQTPHRLRLHLGRDGVNRCGWLTAPLTGSPYPEQLAIRVQRL